MGNDNTEKSCDCTAVMGNKRNISVYSKKTMHVRPIDVIPLIRNIPKMHGRN